MRFAGQSHHWVSRLAASFLFGAVSLRSILVYRSSAELGLVLGLLLIWLLLAVSEPVVVRKVRWYFPAYLAGQTAIVFVLLKTPGFPDFFATLLIILSGQVMLRLNPRVGIIWIGFCAVAVALLLVGAYGGQAVALSLVYTAGNVLLGFYALATRRAQDTHIETEKFAGRLQEANSELQAYSSQMKGLGAARERNRLARDLHDSVTQTVFSMSLAAQSAALLLDRKPGRVAGQLEHLGQLAKSALSEMRLLVSELHPTDVVEGGLVPALKRHLTGRRFVENLSVSLHAEGDGALTSAEEQGLFRIAQEALNNVTKHARASQASIRIYLDEPFWMEIEDQGQGFDLQQALAGRGVGLSSMYERAAEIGWDLQVTTSPGKGTRIRAVKRPPEGRKA